MSDAGFAGSPDLYEWLLKRPKGRTIRRFKEVNVDDGVEQGDGVLPVRIPEVSDPGVREASRHRSNEQSSG